MAVKRFAGHNCIAAFRDLEQAEEALISLHEEGFGNEQLSILGQPVEQVDLADEEHETGEPIGGEVGKEILTGAVTGGALGGVATALGTAAVATIPGVGLVAGTGALIGLASGAGAGSTVGAILGGEAGMRTDHSWKQAIEAIREGAVVLGVHDDEEGTVQRACEVLEAEDPMTLHRVNDRGHEVTIDD